ncbi:MAG: hypothetical protein R3Y07_00970 [Eubacteriales bacterium]
MKKPEFHGWILFLSYLLACYTGLYFTTFDVFSWKSPVGGTQFLLIWTVIAILHRESKKFLWISAGLQTSVCVLWLLFHTEIGVTMIEGFMSIRIVESIITHYFFLVFVPYMNFAYITDYWAIIPLIHAIFFGFLALKYRKTDKKNNDV